MSASFFLIQTSLNPSQNVFPIKAIELNTASPDAAITVFLLGFATNLYIAWSISLFIQTFLVKEGSFFAKSTSIASLADFAIRAVIPVKTPINPTVAAAIGSKPFSFFVFFSYNFSGNSTVSAIIRELYDSFNGKFEFIKTPSFTESATFFCV